LSKIIRGEQDPFHPSALPPSFMPPTFPGSSIDPDRRGKFVIKSVSAKRRPRRSA